MGWNRLKLVVKFSRVLLARNLRGWNPSKPKIKSKRLHTHENKAPITGLIDPNSERLFKIKPRQ